MTGFAALFFTLGVVSLALVGLGFVGAGWSGVEPEVVAVWTIGGAMVLLSAVGCRLSRSGARPWKILVGSALLLASLATLLGILE
jgi:hypothetical protein